MARKKKTEAPAVTEAPVDVIEEDLDDEPDEVVAERPAGYRRSFTLPAESFYGTDEEIETYAAGVIREAQLLGQRPEKAELIEITTDDTAKTITVVFQVS